MPNYLVEGGKHTYHDIYESCCTEIVGSQQEVPAAVSRAFSVLGTTSILVNKTEIAVCPLETAQERQDRYDAEWEVARHKAVTWAEDQGIVIHTDQDIYDIVRHLDGLVS